MENNKINLTEAVGTNMETGVVDTLPTYNIGVVVEEKYQLVVYERNEVIDYDNTNVEFIEDDITMFPRKIIHISEFEKKFVKLGSNDSGGIAFGIRSRDKSQNYKYIIIVVVADNNGDVEIVGGGMYNAPLNWGDIIQLLEPKEINCVMKKKGCKSLKMEENTNEFDKLTSSHPYLYVEDSSNGEAYIELEDNCIFTISDCEFNSISCNYDDTFVKFNDIIEKRKIKKVLKNVKKNSFLLIEKADSDLILDEIQPNVNRKVIMKNWFETKKIHKNQGRDRYYFDDGGKTYLAIITGGIKS